MEKLKIIKSVKENEYFGNYRGIEWIVQGIKDGNKMWWYLTQNGEKLDTPTLSKKETFNNLKENIDYMLDEEKFKIGGNITTFNYSIGGL